MICLSLDEEEDLLKAVFFCLGFHNAFFIYIYIYNAKAATSPFLEMPDYWTFPSRNRYEVTEVMHACYNYFEKNPMSLLPNPDSSTSTVQTDEISQLLHDWMCS